jgi:hypothetical protein
MEKLFVKYEEALALKELGFDEPCFGYYKDGRISGVSKWDRKDWEFHILTNKEITNLTSEIILAPTFSQAFRFFREKYNISYSIDWMSRSLEFYNGYYVHFRGINGNKINQENFIVLNDELPPKGYGVYKTYEEAELACLIKLIEIVKNK